MSAESPVDSSPSPSPAKRGRGRPRGENYEKNLRKTKRKTDRALEREATATGIRYNVRVCGQTYSAIGEHWIVQKLKTRRDALRAKKKKYRLKMALNRTEGLRLDSEARQIAQLVGPGMRLCRKCYSINPAPLLHPHPHFDARSGVFSCVGNPVVQLGDADPAEPAALSLQQ